MDDTWRVISKVDMVYTYTVSFMHAHIYTYIPAYSWKHVYLLLQREKDWGEVGTEGITHRVGVTKEDLTN